MFTWTFRLMHLHFISIVFITLFEMEKTLLCVDERAEKKLTKTLFINLMTASSFSPARSHGLRANDFYGAIWASQLLFAVLYDIRSDKPHKKKVAKTKNEERNENETESIDIRTNGEWIVLLQLLPAALTKTPHGRQFPFEHDVCFCLCYNTNKLHQVNRIAGFSIVFLCFPCVYPYPYPSVYSLCVCDRLIVCEQFICVKRNVYTHWKWHAQTLKFRLHFSLFSAQFYCCRCLLCHSNDLFGIHAYTFAFVSEENMCCTRIHL